MNEISIRIDKLSKYFIAPLHDWTTLVALKNCFRAGSFFRKHWVLNEINLEIKKGQKVALIGRNGSGKTTLLRILSGIYSPSTGSLWTEDEPNVLFQNWMDLNGNADVADNLMLFALSYGIPKKEIKTLESEILDFAELREERDTPFKNISLGQQQRLTLSVILHAPSRILFFDDSFNGIDSSFKQRFDSDFESHLREKTCIIASHDCDLLKKHCEKAIWLADGTVCMFDSIHKVLSAYQESSLAPADSSWSQ